MLRGRKVTILITVLFLLSGRVYADVSKFSFTTDPQTVSPDTPSSIITVQSQDAAGASLNIPNTMFVTFTSTSPTGQFYSNTTGTTLVMPVTMAKNSQNKNFYYKDSVLGTYTLEADVALVKGGTTLFTAQQQIIIGTPVVATSTNATTTQSTTNNTQQNSYTNTIIQVGDSSVHYSHVPLSTLAREPVYKVGAGRPRLSTVDTPIEFKGESTISFSSETIYKWSFGDGAIGYGEMLSHTYKYPGEYVVVLNASSHLGESVSRADVRVIPADFSITLASPEKINIKNNSNSEINLFGRVIESEGNTFIFPEDTIIKPKQEISFPSSITKLNPLNISNTRLAIVGDSINKSFVPTAVNTEITKNNDTSDMYARVEEIQKELSEIKVQQVENTANALAAIENIPTIDISNNSVSTTTPVRQSWLEKFKLFLFGK